MSNNKDKQEQAIRNRVNEIHEQTFIQFLETEHKKYGNKSISYKQKMKSLRNLDGKLTNGIIQLSPKIESLMSSKSKKDDFKYSEQLDFGYIYEPWKNDKNETAYVVDPCMNTFKFVSHNDDDSLKRVFLVDETNMSQFCTNYNQFLSHPNNKQVVINEHKFGTKENIADFNREIPQKIRNKHANEWGHIFFIKPATNSGSYYILHVPHDTPPTQFFFNLSRERHEHGHHGLPDEIFFMYFIVSNFPTIYQQTLKEIDSDKNKQKVLIAAKKQKKKQEQENKIEKTNKQNNDGDNNKLSICIGGSAIVIAVCIIILLIMKK